MFGTKKQSGKGNMALYRNFELAQQMTYYIIFSTRSRKLSVTLLE